MQDSRAGWVRQEAGVRQIDQAGAARLELVSGVVQLRPQEAMVDAMLRGWRCNRRPAGFART
jgi:integrase/recombinase XerC